MKVILKYRDGYKIFVLEIFNMKNLALVIMATLTLTASAYADGFYCASDELVVKVYNNTNPYVGTRNAAAMIISDPAVRYGNKTIARFSDANSTLGNQGATYTALVDLRYNDSARKGELLAGTKLGQVKAIILDVAFSYVAPLAHGDETSGFLTIVKRDGQEIQLEMNCVRYLKN